MRGWLTKPLGDVCTFERGLTYSKSDEVAHSNNGVLRANNIDLETNSLDLNDIRYISDSISVPQNKKVRKGSLLMCTASGSRSHLGKVALIDDDYDLAFGGFMGLLTPRTDVDSRFLYYALSGEGFRVKLESLASGTNINNLKFKDVADFPIVLPSLEEQRRIVVVLDDALAAIATATANTEKILRNVRELFDAALEKIIGGATSGAPAGKLAEHLALVTYGFTNPMPTTDKGPFMVTAKNIRNGEIDYSSARFTSEAAFNNLLTDKSRPEVGDVLLTKDGTLGRVAVVDRAGICINQSVALLRPKGSLESQFLKFLLMTNKYQRQMVQDAGGATIKHIYITRVDKMIVSIPDLASQRSAIERANSLMDACAQLDATAKAKLAELAILKEAALHAAFSGELGEQEPLAA